MTNKVNIEFLQKQVEKMLEDIEMLKDKNRRLCTRMVRHNNRKWL